MQLLHRLNEFLDSEWTQNITRGLPSLRNFPLLQFQDNAMDLWGFKKWRSASIHQKI